MKKLKTCLESLRARTGFQPQVALILGSGLGDYADSIDIEQTVSYSEIEGFPTSTVTGHKGQFVFGYVQGVPVVIMQGRVHYYEGYPITDVVLPTRLMGLMGAKKLILINAAGGINPGFQPGKLLFLFLKKCLQKLHSGLHLALIACTLPFLKLRGKLWMPPTAYRVQVLPDAAFYFVILLITDVFRLLQPYLKLLIQLRVKQSAKNFPALCGISEQKLLKIPLGNHGNLGELPVA